MIAVGQVWALNTNGERWRIEQDRGNGEYLVRALDGPHKGKTDAVFGAEIRSGATLEQMADLSFAMLREQNESRTRRWHPGFPDDEWNGADWSNAMCGEAGETANVVKKLRRHEAGHPGALDGDEAELHDALANELADVICYADLLAAKYGINLAVAVASKFNRVSERQGFPERLATGPTSEGEESDA